jgi:hypothetical protein
MTTSPKPPPELAVSFWVPNPQAPITPVVLRIKAAPRLHLVVQAPHSPPPPPHPLHWEFKQDLVGLQPWGRTTGKDGVSGLRW